MLNRLKGYKSYKYSTETQELLCSTLISELNVLENPPEVRFSKVFRHQK